jgi:Domain of unknown function (DUF4105)
MRLSRIIRPRFNYSASRLTQWQHHWVFSYLKYLKMFPIGQIRLIWLLACTVLFLFQTSAFAAVDRVYLEELVAKSKQLRLAERPEWMKLLHYVPNLIAPGVHGLVDSPHFYNAPDGKNDPRAELEATLASFYSDIEENNEQQNPQCLFIARYTWLNQQLAFDPRRLPQRECKRYQKWHDGLNPSGLTLIFASAYLNSPSSMYGHPLVRVDAKDQDEHTRLLAYAITFAANTDETNGLTYAMSGLFGGYQGVFSVLPYYIKVREYSNLENRDLWEYQLNLAPEEVEWVLMHAWELGPIYFQYYFFDENCAYHLLGLLQVARPELDLTSNFRWWAIPSDAVREIAKQPDLLKKVVYRPSNATMVKFELSLLDKSERKLTKDLSMRHVAVNDPSFSALPESRAAAVLETSQDYVSYLRATGNNDVSDPAELTRELLTARSRLDVVAQAPGVPVPKVRPDQGHGSSRVALGIGQKDRNNFQELSARATYHDIMDSNDGYARGAELEFFSLGLRHYDSGASRIEKFTPINILSLTPRDDFFQSMSWKISAGWQRTRISDGSEPLAFSLDGGAGGAWSNKRDTALWYAFFDSSARVNNNLENGFALGAGASVGGLFDFSPRWRLHGYVRGMRYFLGQPDTPRSFGLEQRLAFGRDLAMRVNFARNRELKSTYNSGLVSMLFYF